ncbi:shikimate kinase, partial [Rhodovulum sulfidophilum]|uniref:shikimate kinase n=1 Tax=Rhodovulum sulfidophilum TaxID=35806 RepID=UPI002DD43E40
MDRNIFLIGPGGIGKTSSGRNLAELLGREFIDLDEKFMSGPGHIGQYISEHGYAKYVRENSNFFFED